MSQTPSYLQGARTQVLQDIIGISTRKQCRIDFRLKEYMTRFCNWAENWKSIPSNLDWRRHPKDPFQFVGLPLGIKHAAQAYQGYMQNILGHLDFIIICVHELFISSYGMQKHLEHLSIILNNLLESGTNGCLLRMRSISWVSQLAHMISSRPRRKPKPFCPTPERKYCRTSSTTRQSIISHTQAKYNPAQWPASKWKEAK